ncbi:MAG: hypothetical protein Q4C53_02310 [Clostridia bacterium]|nr:hypothetical protein [Clostridia bacterium]
MWFLIGLLAAPALFACGARLAVETGFHTERNAGTAVPESASAAWDGESRETELTCFAESLDEAEEIAAIHGIRLVRFEGDTKTAYFRAGDTGDAECICPGAGSGRTLLKFWKTVKDR